MATRHSFIEKQDFLSILRKAGYRATSQRICVLDILRTKKKPVTAQTIAEAAYACADQATVYRVLKQLKEADIIRQVDFQHSHAHYELVDIKDHHHLICIECGRAEDILGCDIVSMEAAILHTAKGFAEIRRHALEFYGICNACKKKLPKL